LRPDPIASAAKKAATLWLAQERLKKTLGADGDTSTPAAQRRLRALNDAYRWVLSTESVATRRD
jgi:hypothetical protein